MRKYEDRVILRCLPIMRLAPAHRRGLAVILLVAVVFALMRLLAPASLIRLLGLFSQLWAPVSGALYHHPLLIGVAVVLFLMMGALYVIVKAVAPDELLKAIALLWGFWCWTYIIRWKIGMASRHKVFSSVIGVLFAASFYVVVETLLVAVRILFPDTIPYIPHLHAPRWLEAILFPLSLLMVHHHWREWRLRSLNADMPAVIEKLLRQLERSRILGTGTWTPESRVDFLEKLMFDMRAVLERNRKRRIAFSLMEKDDDGDLVVIYFYPPSAEAHNAGPFRLKASTGAAGAAFARRNSIYVPSTRHLMAIDVEKNETIGQIYQPDPPDCPYHCVFCVPVLSNTGEVTVLTISCTEKSSLDVFEFSVGRLMAALIAMLG